MESFPTRKRREEKITRIYLRTSKKGGEQEGQTPDCYPSAPQRVICKKNGREQREGGGFESTIRGAWEKLPERGRGDGRTKKLESKKYNKAEGKRG